MSEESRRPGLSACIVAMNEEDRIGDCLESVAFCDEILVVDSHSTDRTRDIAREHGARVVERNWPGMPEQRWFSLSEASNDWVLCVDADERITPELRAEIEELRTGTLVSKAGWCFPRLTNYLGEWVHHGTWYPDYQLRLVDRRRARVGGSDPHDHLEVDGEVGRLKGNLLHFAYRSFGDHLRTIDKYTTIMARGLHERGRRAGLFEITVRPWVRWLRFYVFKRGFLLGWHGLVLAGLASHYVRMKYTKLLLLQKGKKLE